MKMITDDNNSVDGNDSMLELIRSIFAPYSLTCRSHNIFIYNVES